MADQTITVVIYDAPGSSGAPADGVVARRLWWCDRWGTIGKGQDERCSFHPKPKFKCGWVFMGPIRNG